MGWVGTWRWVGISAAGAAAAASGFVSAGAGTVGCSAAGCCWVASAIEILVEGGGSWEGVRDGRFNQTLGGFGVIYRPE